MAYPSDSTPLGLLILLYTKKQNYSAMNLYPCQRPSRDVPSPPLSLSGPQKHRQHHQAWLSSPFCQVCPVSMPTRVDNNVCPRYHSRNRFLRKHDYNHNDSPARGVRCDLRLRALLTAALLLRCQLFRTWRDREMDLLVSFLKCTVELGYTESRDRIFISRLHCPQAWGFKLQAANDAAEQQRGQSIVLSGPVSSSRLQQNTAT